MNHKEEEPTQGTRCLSTRLLCKDSTSFLPTHTMVRAHYPLAVRQMSGNCKNKDFLGRSLMPGDDYTGASSELEQQGEADASRSDRIQVQDKLLAGGEIVDVEAILVRPERLRGK